MKKMKKMIDFKLFTGRILLLSPHMDDEVLGCGGLIHKIMLDNSADLHIHYFTDVHPLFECEVTRKENKQFIEAVGATGSISMFGNMTNKLEMVPIIEHITEIENLVNDYKPDTVLVTFPSYNQDHRRVFEATITATRPHDKNYYVKNILLYEQPETIHSNRLEPYFIPHIFLPIDMDGKFDLYGIYETQVRGHRTLGHLQALAALRGSQCNSQFAESFMVTRLTYKLE